MNSGKYTKRMSEIVMIYLTAMLCIYPLYIKDYSNVGQTKFFCYLVLTSLLFYWTILEIGTGTRPVDSWKERIGDPACILMAGVPIIGGLSTLVSLNRADSVLGLHSYYGGWAMLTAGFIGYLLVRLFVDPKDIPALLKGMTVTVGAVVLLYGLNLLKIDPLHIQNSVTNIEAFLSTIGHVDFTGSFLALYLPIVISMFLSAENREDVLFYGIFGISLSGTLCMVNSDGALLGTTAAIGVMICSRTFDSTRLRRLVFLGVGACVWALVLHRTAAERTLLTELPFFSELYRMALPFLIVGILVWLGLYFCEKKNDKALSLYIPGRITVSGAAAVMLILFVLANKKVNPIQLPAGLANFFVWGPDWGTRRGVCWIELTRIWGASTIGRKLFGYGIGMTHTVLGTLSGSQDAYLLAFFAAHNEFLEELIASGLIGCLIWVGVWISHLSVMMKKHSDQRMDTVDSKLRIHSTPAAEAILAGLVGYLVQSFVSIRVSSVFPMVLLLLALLQIAVPSQTGTADREQARGVQKTQIQTPEYHKTVAVSWGIRIVLAVAFILISGKLAGWIFAGL